MVRCRVVLSAALFFVVLPSITMDRIVAMDKRDKSIKKVINIAGIKGVTFCGNEEILINRWARYDEKGEFCKVINVSNNQCIDLLAQAGKSFRSLNPDSDKKRVLLSGDFKDVFIYDSQAKKMHSQRLSYIRRAWAIGFGCSPHTILFENSSSRSTISSCDYYDGSTVLEEKLSAILEKNPALYVDKYLPTQKILLFSTSQAIEGAYLYDCVEDELRCLVEHNVGYADCSSDASFVIYHHGPYHSTDRCSRVGGGKYVCDRNGCYILHLHNKRLIALDHDNDYCDSVVIHPSNKIVTTLSAVEKVIRHFCVQTGRCIAQHYSPTPEKDRICQKAEGRSNQDCLSFSSDGTMFAAIFPTQCVIYKVPFKVIYEVGDKKKFALMLWALKKYDDGLLPNEVVRLFMENVMKISKL